MLTPALEKLARVVDPETGMSPLYAAYQFVAFSAHSVQDFLDDAWLAGCLTETLLHRGYSPDTQIGLAGTTLRNWHARQRQSQAWRQVKDETPPAGVRVRVWRDFSYSSEDSAARYGNSWVNGNWHGHSEVRINPTDWWQPITPPPGVEGK